MKSIFLFLVCCILIGCDSKVNGDAESNIDSSSTMITDSTASCHPNGGKSNATGSSNRLSENNLAEFSQNLKPINPDLPIVGLLMYDDVLTTELTAPMDVFTKNSEDGKQMFNVILIAENFKVITSEEGLKMLPDYTINNAPNLDILIVPSAYDMSEQVKNKNLVAFIQRQNNNTEYTVSNCAGASLIGESGIADGKKIVTWIGGGTDLQKNYPNLKVQDDGKVSFMEDGKFLSSNGNLASYISSLELLEKLTSKKHRKFVESYLYLDRLQNWKD